MLLFDSVVLLWRVVNMVVVWLMVLCGNIGLCVVVVGRFVLICLVVVVVGKVERLVCVI